MDVFFKRVLSETQEIKDLKCFGLPDHRSWACKSNARKVRVAKRGGGGDCWAREMFSYVIRQKKS